MTDKKAHWENIYDTKSVDEVSWFQPLPQTSLTLVDCCMVSKDASIIDVGGGDSFLTDHLLKLGYTNLTVLDISESAINRAKQRLGSDAEKVHWIVSDIVDFEPTQQYEVWHDRAAFHFLTEEEHIQKYKALTKKFIQQNGHLILGTFSENGPDKCSGIPIKKYSTADLIRAFESDFLVVRYFNHVHETPFNTTQDFSFFVGRKK